MNQSFIQHNRIVFRFESWTCLSLSLSVISWGSCCFLDFLLSFCIPRVLVSKKMHTKETTCDVYFVFLSSKNRLLVLVWFERNKFRKSVRGSPLRESCVSFPDSSFFTSMFSCCSSFIVVLLFMPLILSDQKFFAAASTDSMRMTRTLTREKRSSAVFQCSLRYLFF